MSETVGFVIISIEGLITLSGDLFAFIENLSIRRPKWIHGIIGRVVGLLNVGICKNLGIDSCAINKHSG